MYKKYDKMQENENILDKMKHISLHICSSLNLLNLVKIEKKNDSRGK